MKEPFFSVVIPVHNKEPHIRRSISSVLKQSFSNFELIVIDDASTDGSILELEKFDDQRIRILKRDTPGPGGYAARNLGIEKAKSDWIAFLDADDEWENIHLEKYHEIIHNYPEVDFLVSGYDNIFSSGNGKKINANRYYQINSNRGDHKLNLDDFLLAENSGAGPISTIIVCIRKNLIQSSDKFPAGKTNRGGDVDTWLRCIENSSLTIWSAHIGAKYYRDSVNMVTKKSLGSGVCERETVNRLLKYYSGKTANLLKKFANMRTVNSWKNNVIVSGKPEISLYDKLYLSVNPVKNTFIIFCSLLPPNTYLIIRKVFKKLTNKN